MSIMLILLIGGVSVYANIKQCRKIILELPSQIWIDAALIENKLRTEKIWLGSLLFHLLMFGLERDGHLQSGPSTDHSKRESMVPGAYRLT